MRRRELGEDGGGGGVGHPHTRSITGRGEVTERGLTETVFSSPSISTCKTQGNPREGGREKGRQEGGGHTLKNFPSEGP